MSEDRSFNYNDLNLDFLELSPPRAKLPARNINAVSNTSSFRATAFKAKQLALKVAQSDMLVNKIELLKNENCALQIKLKDFQKSAAQIQELYENEKSKCTKLQVEFTTVELNWKMTEKMCADLNHDLEEKKLQLEQLEAQIGQEKGPLTYTELAMKYLKLFQKVDEEEQFGKQAKSLFSELSTYCENNGCKVPQLKVKNRKKRIYKKDKDVQCNIIDVDLKNNSNDCKSHSTHTAIGSNNSIQTQTDLSVRHLQTLTSASAESTPKKSFTTQGVQTKSIEVHTQGTQHISTTTTRGTSTSCFIKKHNVGTCFPEPTYVSPVTVMVEELLQSYNVQPLSPISDPISPAIPRDLDIPPTLTATKVSIAYKTVGTCTYLCNVQRQIDFLPLITTIKRSQSSSPSPCACDRIKNEAYATPTPSPPPPPIPQQNLPPQLTPSATNATNTADRLNHSFNNMQPMLNAFTQIPEMQPEIFSTIWQMAGQMFMGLFCTPPNNRIRTSQFNRPSDDLIDQQQFHNWIYTLYESMQHQPQQTSSVVTQTGYQQDGNRGRDRHFNLNAETVNTNIRQSTNNTMHSEEKVTTQENLRDSTNILKNSNGPVNGTDTGENSSPLENSILLGKTVNDRLFKEPNELPKRSAKQAGKRKISCEELTYMKKYRDKRSRKKRKKEKQKKMSVHTNNSLFYTTKINNISGANCEKLAEELSTPKQNELDFATAVEFCANLCNFNSSDGQYNTHAVNDPIYTHCGSMTNTQVMPEISCKESKHFGNIATDKLCNNESNSSGQKRLEATCPRDLSCRIEIKEILTEKVYDKIIGVPDVTISSTNKNTCDTLNDLEAANTTLLQSEHCVNQMKRNNTRSIFGSDSEDEESTANGITKSEYKIQTPSTSLSCQDLQGITNSGEKIANEYIIENNNDKLQETKEVHTGNVDNTCKVGLNKNLSKTIFSSIEKFEKIGKESTGMLLDHCISKSENVENKISCSTQNFAASTEPTFNESYEELLCRFNNNSSSSESEESDEPGLVIVEEDVNSITNKRTTSESSVESGLAYDCLARNFAAPRQKEIQVTSNDTDISSLLDNTLIEDLLASATTKKLYNSILREVEKESREIVAISPRKRKRKIELSNITFCKHSANLRAQQVHDSDESLTSKSNIYNKLPISDDITKSNSDCGNVMPHKKKALSEEQVDKGFQRFTETEQKSLGHEVVTNLTVREIFCDGTAIMVDSVNEKGENVKSPNKIEEPPSESCDTPPIEQANNVKNGDIKYYIPNNKNAPNTSPDLFPSANANSTGSADKIDYDTPSSPPLSCNIHNDELAETMVSCREIPLHLDGEYYLIKNKSVLQHFISSYSSDIYKIVTGQRKSSISLYSKIASQLEKFLNTTRDKVDMLASTLAQSLHEEVESTETICSLIIDGVINAPRPEIELNCELAQVPPKYLNTHLRLTSILLRHLEFKRSEVIGLLLSKIENKLFNYQNVEKIQLESALNLTQLYLISLSMQKCELNPARLFIAKCLYYYSVFAHPMIYEVLCWYPTTLPHRDEKQYDRSDSLITVIQHLLMSNTYNMDTKDLRHKELLSLLRFEYHFEPFKPKALEVLVNLVAKLKAGHLSNLKYAFAIFCKRQIKFVNILLQQQFLPLADEYYKMVQNTDEYDERIAALLDCISAVVKPLPLDTDITLYFSIFERFLSAVQRPVVQEAAVLAILRLQRFGQVRCFHALSHFKPHYPLQLLTSNALKTFIHKKPLLFWKNLLRESQN